MNRSKQVHANSLEGSWASSNVCSCFCSNFLIHSLVIDHFGCQLVSQALVIAWASPSGEFEHRGDGEEKEWRWVPKSEFQGKWQSWSWGGNMDDGDGDDDWYQAGWQDWGPSSWRGHPEITPSAAGQADYAAGGCGGLGGLGGPGGSGGPGDPGNLGGSGGSVLFGHGGCGGFAADDPMVAGPAYVNLDLAFPKLAEDAARRYAETEAVLQEQAESVRQGLQFEETQAEMAREALNFEELTARLANEDASQRLAYRARMLEARQEAMVVEAASAVSLATEAKQEAMEVKAAMAMEETTSKSPPVKASPPFLTPDLQPGVAMGPGGLPPPPGPPGPPGPHGSHEALGPPPPPPAKEKAPAPLRQNANKQTAPKPAVVARTK